MDTPIVDCGKCQIRFNCLTEKKPVPCYIIIDGKRWFEKTNGNTYHSVSVFVNNELIGRVAYAYGYGDQFIQSAFDILSKFGIFSYEDTDERITVNQGQPNEHQTLLRYKRRDEAWHRFRQDMMDNRGRYHLTVIDVARKKDL